jgi:hypothetical protein
MNKLDLHRQSVIDLITQIVCGTPAEDLKPFTQAVYSSMDDLFKAQQFRHSPTHYVSLSRDLMGVYIAYRAESEGALRSYLEAEYLYTGNDNFGKPANVWKLPWASIYTEIPEVYRKVSELGFSLPIHVIDKTFSLITERN